MNYINDKTYCRKVLKDMLSLHVTHLFFDNNNMDKVKLKCLTKNSEVMALKSEPHLHNQTFTDLSPIDSRQICSKSFYLIGY